MKKSKIKSIKKIGTRKTYNLTMESDHHNYAVYSPDADDSFVISANSHSCAYGLDSYLTAYLKANYPDEFFVCSLNVFNEDKKDDKVEDLLKDLKNFDIKLAEKDLNSCHINYKIVKKKDVQLGIGKTEIAPSLMVKGVGINAAKEIESNKPYEDLKDFAKKTDSRLVDQRVMDGLIEAGFFNKYMKDHYKRKKKRLTKDALLSKFGMIRADLKRAGAKGVDTTDLFG